MIDVSTPILGPVDCSADQIISAIYSRSGAPKYDRQTVETIAKGLIHWTDVFNLRTSVVAGQILHETGYFRYGGDVQPDQFNFAGLGATGGIPGAGFPTIDAGIIAVCTHHLVYVLGPKERWPEHLRQYADRDPRYQAVISAGTAGSVTVLGDHRGKWAYPGTTYPERVRDAANLILSQPRNEEESPMPVGIPGVPWIPADWRHYTPGRSVDWPDLLIQHHTDGYDSLGWLTTNANSNVSASYLLNHDGTIRAQLVDHRDTPHTTAAYNPRSISCEWERKWPEQSSIPDATYQRIGEFWAGVVRVERERGNPNFQGVPGRHQLRDHNDFYNTTCPGNLDMDRVYPIMVAALAQQPVPPAVDNPNCVMFHTGFEVCHPQGGFLGHYQEFDGIVTLGFPRSPDFSIDDPTSPSGSRNVQVFDKGILIFLAENPDGQRVQRLHFKSPLWQRVVDRAVADYGDWQAA